MQTIWLVDATVYKKEINLELLNLKRDYFKIKAHVRKNKIGTHLFPTQRTFSIGLLRIASILKVLNYEVEYFHLEEFQVIMESIDSQNLPALIAFGCVCPTIPICEMYSQKLKSKKRDIITAVGGAHINVAYNITRKRYEGFDRYIQGYDLEAVYHLIGVADVKLPLAMPYVDFSILPYKLNEYDINLFSTLGCPFKCSYCQDNKIPYFENDLDGGLHNIKEIFLGKKLIHFFDSTLGYSYERLMHVCKCLSDIRHGFILSCDMRAEYITKKSVIALEKAGFREVRIGLESADEDVLIKNNRNQSADMIHEKFKLIKEYSNLYLTVYSVSGLPSSTIASINKTYEMFHFLLGDKIVDEIKNAQYVPYPADDTDYTKEGIIIHDYNWENYDRQSFPVYSTVELSREQIWGAFIENAKVINHAWLIGNGFGAIDELGSVDVYPEYVLQSYSHHQDE